MSSPLLSSPLQLMVQLTEGGVPDQTRHHNANINGEYEERKVKQKTALCLI